MTYTIKIMPEAYNSIADYARWWGDHHSQEKANQWYEAIIDALFALQKMPESYSLAWENQKTSYTLREMHFGLGKRSSHRALFRISGRTVEVLTVRHVAQGEIPIDDFPA